MSNDIRILRDLASQYLEIATLPIQEERRRLWSRSNSLQRTRPPIHVNFGMWNVWCREVFGDQHMRCEDPFYRGHERALRMKLFQQATGDDTIIEPWITQQASIAGEWARVFGLDGSLHEKVEDGNSVQYKAPLKSWDDMDKLSVTHYTVDEAETARNIARLQEAMGDILPVNVEYGCIYTDFMADLSTCLAELRGLEQIMVDMYEWPDELHRLLAFMRDGVLLGQQEAEDAGAYSLTTQSNQSQIYCDELERPQPNSGPRSRRHLWTHCAAQEYALISPAMHDEFLLQYQLPILAHWGLVSYGCCEDLTQKIDMLRQIPNLRIIAVAPLADVGRCAEQIGADYVISWRPNPTDMVSYGFDETKIRTIIRDGLEKTRGCHVQINLKDIETIEGDNERLTKWTRIVREVIEECWQ